MGIDDTAKLKSEWHEDDGNVLWWNLPIEEAPYAGTPLDDDFPEYKTHWTRIHIPQFAHTTSAELFKELGETPEKAESMERELNAILRRRQISHENLPEEFPPPARPTIQIKHIVRRYGRGNELCRLFIPMSIRGMCRSGSAGF